MLDTYSVGNANQMLTGNSAANYPEYSYSATIPSLTLTAGSSYWLGISDSTTSATIWGWETTNETGAHFQYNSGLSSWVQENSDLAFNLAAPSSTVPEPSTLALLALGLAGIGFTVSRQRKSRMSA